MRQQTSRVASLRTRRYRASVERKLLMNREEMNTAVVCHSIPILRYSIRWSRMEIIDTTLYRVMKN